MLRLRALAFPCRALELLMVATLRRLPLFSMTPLMAMGLIALPTVDGAGSNAVPVPPDLTTVALSGVQDQRVADRDLARTTEDPVLDRAEATDPATGSAAGGDANLVTVATTSRLDTEVFRAAAVTWAGGGPSGDAVAVWARHRSSGAWSEWFRLGSSADHAPQGPEADGVRIGTDPLIVPPSDGVQVRVDAPRGVVVPDLRLDLIDPGTSPADASSAGASASAVAATSRPVIRDRASWGADERLRRGSPAYGQIKAAFVHHTVSSNSYSAADVPAMIRSIYAYHVKSLGWNDVGYNFLVDRFGRIWEGRAGGVDRPVIGAHTYGHNDDAFAMSAIGTHTSTPPSAAVLDAYARLFAWKLGLHGVDPMAQVSLDGVRTNAISGHRDTYATLCPGDALYDQLPFIRSTTADLMGSAPTPPVVEAQVPHSMWEGGRMRATVSTTAAPGTVVKLRARPAGSGEPRRTWSSAVVDDSGVARLRSRRLVAGEWDVRVVVRSQPVVRTARTYVSVKRRPVQTRLSEGRITVGDSARLNVSAPAAAAKGRMALKRRIPGQPWEVVRRVFLRADGSRDLRLRPSERGTYRFKVRVAGVRPAGSNPVRLVVAGQQVMASPVKAPRVGGASVARPADGRFTVQGRGYGHGRGMSQWGAYEAGRLGIPEPRITRTYYPGTTRETRGGNPRMKVLLTRDTGSDLIVRPEAGLAVRYRHDDGTARVVELPASVRRCPAAWWRVVTKGEDFAIQSLCGNDWRTWRRRAVVDGDQPVTFRAGDRTVDVAVRASGGFDRREYRGVVKAYRQGTSLAVVNALRMQAYLRSVVPAEVPASWPEQSLRAQAVAARTYALRERRDRTGFFDVYDSTASQVYQGRRQYDASWRVVRQFEDSRTSKAVAATARVHLRYRGVPAFTQFSSSNGGVSAAGTQPYLRAATDPWDAAARANPRRTWTVSVTAASLERRYPRLGRLKAIRVAERDGIGQWGGRVSSIRLVGSRGNQLVSGDAAIRSALRAYSSYLTVLP